MLQETGNGGCRKDTGVVTIKAVRRKRTEKVMLTIEIMLEFLLRNWLIIKSKVCGQMLIIVN